MQHFVTEIEDRPGGVVPRVRANTPNGPIGVPRRPCHLARPTSAPSCGRSTPSPRAAVSAAAEGLRYRDFLVVALILDREKLFPDNWIYIHTPGVKVGRIQNFNNWSEAMVPDAGTHLPRPRVFLLRG